MPLNRDKKADLVASYEDGLASAPNAFVIGFEGLSVVLDTELRDKIRNCGSHYQVVKNTLVLRAIAGKPLEEVKGTFKGATAVAYSNDDAVGLAKVLTEFAKDAPAVQFKAGLVEGKIVEVEQIREIASLPSRDDLIAKLLYLLQSPLTRLVRGLGALPRSLVIVMDQVAKQKE